MNILIEPCQGSGGSKSEYEIVHPELISVAVTTPVIERASSSHVTNAGSATGGVLLVTTSAVYSETPMSFSRLSR